MQLSERAKQLIPKSRIVSFDNWKDLHSDEVIAIFQQADDESRYLSDEDLEKIQILAPHLSVAVKKAKLLRENAAEIVAQARQEVLAQYPNLTQPGGDLYPAERAEICWRDFWHFLRCISYGVVGENTHYTSQEGLDNMQLLYQEVRVPLKAMVLGLEGLKIFSLKRFNEHEQAELAPYFDHLVNQMKQFSAA